MKNKPFSIKTVFFLLICLAVFCMPAAAQKGETVPYTAITMVNLGTDKVELEVGESYTFQVTYEPEVPFIKELIWFLANKDIAEIDMAGFTITAKQPGQSMLMVYSFDKNAFDSCEIVVKGDRGTEKTRSGKKLMSASASDLAKIKAIDINKYLEAVSNTKFTEEQYAEAMQEPFRAIAHVKPGTEEAQAQRARDFGMTDPCPLDELHLVTLQGTLEQILNYVRKNKDLEFLEGETLDFIIDPIDEEFSTESVQKAFNLGSNAATLTQIKKAHDLGYNGNGQTVAIIDTGLDSSHEQFKGRVTKEHCFTSSFTSDGISFVPACTGTDHTESSSAKPFIYSSSTTIYNHGSHVAGIAAGRDGIAPKAKIIAVLAASEANWSCSSGTYFVGNGRCATTLLSGSDKVKAYNWLLKLVNNGTKIAAINMSYGGGKYSSTCDGSDSETTAMKTFAEKGVIPVAASGNDAYVGNINSPACLTKVVAVGALADKSTPTLAVYSNNSKQVDILAPGSKIYSAYLSGHGNMSGTSMATPMVTGAMAILKQAYPNQTFAEYNAFYKLISTKTAQKDEYDYDFGYTRPVLDFTKFGNNVLGTLSIAVNNIRGYTKGITMKFSPVKNASGYTIYIYDNETGTKINSKVTITVEWDSTYTYHVIRIEGDYLENGHPYKITVQPYRKIGSYTYRGTAKTYYGAPNPRITAITAAPNDAKATFRTVKHATADGFRYNVYEEGNPTRFKYIDVPIGGSLVKTVTGMTNGTLYYVTAIPYTTINSTKYWGASMYRIYFVPLSAPASVQVAFSGSTAAFVSMKTDSAADGIKVLYRPAGGTLQNGCEADGTSCTVSGLNKSSAYQFYILKYKTVNGKKHYSPGTLYSYKASAPGLAAPTKPLIAKRGAKLLSFTIVKDSKAVGISVLYRENEGPFKQACEVASNTCQCNGFDWNKDYTFYIMQYKLINGKKIYSPGITVTNWLTPKSVDDNSTEELNGLVYTADEEPADLYEVLEDYYTEDDVLYDEAMMFLAAEEGVKKKSVNDAGTALYGEVIEDEFFDDLGEDLYLDIIEENPIPGEGVMVDIPDPLEDEDVPAEDFEGESSEASGIFLGYDTQTGEFVGAKSVGVKSDETDSAASPSNDYPSVQFYTVGEDDFRSNAPIPSFGN